MCPLKPNEYLSILILTAIIACLIAVFCCGCSVSMTNVMNVGQSSDLLDENQSVSPDVDADLSVPFFP